MTDLLKRAVAKLRSLPPRRQNEIAELMFILAEQQPEEYEFSDEQITRIKTGLAQADTKQFLTDEEVESLFRRPRS